MVRKVVQRPGRDPDKQNRPRAYRVSGRTFSAGMCCTIRAEWIWMDRRWWIFAG